MDGILIINKGKNCTSHDVVYKIKKMFGKKVGHTGTLDPNATGVLPILIGKGTELSQFLINHDKKYIATVQLGVKTETADGEGAVIEEKEVDANSLDAEKVKRVLIGMVGRQKQVPPIYSAIKVNGKKLYEYARSGKSVDIPTREIEIYELKLISVDSSKKQINFEIFCSKGTYIRSVCEKLAEALGTVGYMKELQRVVVGSFSIEDSITVDELEKNFENKEYLKEKMIGIEDFFKNSPKVVLNDKKLNLFLNGVMLEVPNLASVTRVYDEKCNFIGIGVNCNGRLKRNIIVPLGTYIYGTSSPYIYAPNGSFQKMQL